MNDWIGPFLFVAIGVIIVLVFVMAAKGQPQHVIQECPPVCTVEDGSVIINCAHKKVDCR